MKKIAILILIILMSFSGFVYYKLKIVKWAKLSDYWSLTYNTNRGYVLYSKQDRSMRNFEYLNLDELFIDRKNNILYLKNNYPNQRVYYYQKIYLDRYDVYDIKLNDIVLMENKTYHVRDLNFVSPWRVIVFSYK